MLQAGFKDGYLIKTDYNLEEDISATTTKVWLAKGRPKQHQPFNLASVVVPCKYPHDRLIAPEVSDLRSLLDLLEINARG